MVSIEVVLLINDIAQCTFCSVTTLALLMLATSPCSCQSKLLADRAYIRGEMAQATPPATPPATDNTVRGSKQYELCNHLGNVLATVSDCRIQTATLLAGTSGVAAELLSASDYYAFGMEMPGRQLTILPIYRYGFNGKEDDNELKEFGNQQDYGMRTYDPRIGKFLSVDPLTKQYPNLTPYQFANNTPIRAVDLDGREEKGNIEFNRMSMKGGSKIKKPDAKEIAEQAAHELFNNDIRKFAQEKFAKEKADEKFSDDVQRAIDGMTKAMEVLKDPSKTPNDKIKEVKEMHLELLPSDEHHLEKIEIEDEEPMLKIHKFETTPAPKAPVPAPLASNVANKKGNSPQKTKKVWHTNKGGNGMTSSLDPKDWSAPNKKGKK
jgi:RHS repeat-associated protein